MGETLWARRTWLCEHDTAPTQTLVRPQTTCSSANMMVTTSRTSGILSVTWRHTPRDTDVTRTPRAWRVDRAYKLNVNVSRLLHINKYSVHSGAGGPTKWICWLLYPPLGGVWSVVMSRYVCLSVRFHNWTKSSVHAEGPRDAPQIRKIVFFSKFKQVRRLRSRPLEDTVIPRL